MTIVSARISQRLVAARSPALQYLPGVAFLIDAALMTASVMVAVLSRRHLPVYNAYTDISRSVALVGPVLVICWLAVLWAFGAYRRDVFGAGADEFKRVFNAGMYAAGFLGVGCYLAKYSLSRGFFVLAFLVGIPALLLGRVALRRFLKHARTHGVLQERVLIVGGPRHVDDVAAVLRRERWLGYSIAGAVVPSSYSHAETPGGVPVIGHADDLADLPQLATGADVLFVTGGTHHSSTELRRLAWDLEHDHVQLVVAPSVTDVSSDRVRVRPVGGLPLMHIERPRWANATRWAKRTFDVVGSSLLIFAALPVLVYAAVCIKLYDRGPIFFRQTRIGRDGAQFQCLKFRTMVVNAEALIKQLQEENGLSALRFKLKDDPRITGPGKWMRRLSIDELPQLFNVLRGDMSLVGPRPQVQQEVDLYDDALRRRLHVRPGITGLWQVSGRNDLTLEEAARLDLYYVDNWSMLQDLAILGRTAGAVLGSRGAY
ncbi:sugar transferase [Nocardioides sp. KR10-350]|uniref:sugar transferase n=1 Tax=Nocardioides cheoyonin TaxID=3156615 RepID=UPI0032B4FC59